MTIYVCARLHIAYSLCLAENSSNVKNERVLLSDKRGTQFPTTSVTLDAFVYTNSAGQRNNFQPPVIKPVSLHNCRKGYTYIYCSPLVTGSCKYQHEDDNKA